MDLARLKFAPKPATVGEPEGLEPKEMLRRMRNVFETDQSKPLRSPLIILLQRNSKGNYTMHSMIGGEEAPAAIMVQLLGKLFREHKDLDGLIYIGDGWSWPRDVFDKIKEKFIEARDAKDPITATRQVIDGHPLPRDYPEDKRMELSAYYLVGTNGDFVCGMQERGMKHQLLFADEDLFIEQLMLYLPNEINDALRRVVERI